MVVKYSPLYIWRIPSMPTLIKLFCNTWPVIKILIIVKLSSQIFILFKMKVHCYSSDSIQRFSLKERSTNQLD